MVRASLALDVYHIHIVCSAWQMLVALSTYPCSTCGKIAPKARRKAPGAGIFCNAAAVHSLQLAFAMSRVHEACRSPCLYGRIPLWPVKIPIGV